MWHWSWQRQWTVVVCCASRLRKFGQLVCTASSYSPIVLHYCCCSFCFFFFFFNLYAICNHFSTSLILYDRSADIRMFTHFVFVTLCGVFVVAGKWSCMHALHSSLTEHNRVAFHASFGSFKRVFAQRCTFVYIHTYIYSYNVFLIVGNEGHRYPIMAYSHPLLCLWFVLENSYFSTHLVSLLWRFAIVMPCYTDSALLKRTMAIGCCLAFGVQWLKGCYKIL